MTPPFKPEPPTRLLTTCERTLLGQARRKTGVKIYVIADAVGFISLRRGHLGRTPETE